MPQVGTVDLVPDPVRLLHGLLLGEMAVTAEVRRRVAKGGLAQPQEALGVPKADVLRRGIDVHGEIEEVAHRQTDPPVATDPGRLEHVEPFDQHDVRTLDGELLVR